MNKEKFVIKDILTNKKKLDRRYYLVQRFKQFLAAFVLGSILGALFGCYLADGGSISIGSPEVLEQTIEVKAVEDTPEPQKVTGHSIPWLIDKIHFMESTRGKNGVTGSLQKYCENKGLWNEYGYGGMAKKICFKDQSEADETMIKWFEKQFRTKTESETVCYYRYGEIMPDCDYYQKILNETNHL